MTDIIKNFQQTASGKMMAYLRESPAFEEDNIAAFEAELEDLGVDRPTLIAFGGDAYRILIRNLHGRFDICKVMHYSHFISKEKYRKSVSAVISSMGMVRGQVRTGVPNPAP